MKTKIHTLIGIIALSFFLMDYFDFSLYEKWLGFNAFNIPTLAILILALVIPNVIHLRKNGYSLKASSFLFLGILPVIFYYIFIGNGILLLNGMFTSEMPGLTVEQKNEIISNINTDTLPPRELHFASKLLALDEYHTTGNIITHYDLSGNTVIFTPTPKDIGMRESTIQVKEKGKEMLPEVNFGFWLYIVIFSLLIIGSLIWPVKNQLTKGTSS